MTSANANLSWKTGRALGPFLTAALGLMSVHALLAVIHHFLLIADYNPLPEKFNEYFRPPFFEKANLNFAVVLAPFYMVVFSGIMATFLWKRWGALVALAYLYILTLTELAMVGGSMMKGINVQSAEMWGGIVFVIIFGGLALALQGRLKLFDAGSQQARAEAAMKEVAEKQQALSQSLSEPRAGGFIKPEAPKESEKEKRDREWKEQLQRSVNTARGHMLNKAYAAAFDQLEGAVRSGYRDWGFLENDHILAPLKQMDGKRWGKLVAKAGKK